jgi:hypothetical protein
MRLRVDSWNKVALALGRPQLTGPIRDCSSKSKGHQVLRNECDECAMITRMCIS